MDKKAVLIVRPKIEGISDYCAKLERLAELLNEALQLMDEIDGTTFEVSYDFDSTLNS